MFTLGELRDQWNKPQRKTIQTICTGITHKYKRADYIILHDGRTTAYLNLDDFGNNTLVTCISYGRPIQTWNEDQPIQAIDPVKMASKGVAAQPSYQSNDQFVCINASSWHRDYKVVKDGKYVATLTLFDMIDKTGVFYQTLTDYCCFLDETPFCNYNPINLAKQAAEKPKVQIDLNIKFTKELYHIPKIGFCLSFKDNNIIASNGVSWTRGSIDSLDNVLPFIKEGILRLFLPVTITITTSLYNHLIYEVKHNNKVYELHLQQYSNGKTLAYFMPVSSRSLCLTTREVTDIPQLARNLLLI